MSSKEQREEQEQASAGPGGLRRTVLLMLGFSGLIVCSRMFSLGFTGYLEQGILVSSDSWYVARTLSTIAVLLVLAFAGYKRLFSVGPKTFGAAAAIMAVGAVVLAMDKTGALGSIVAVLGGASDAVLMHSWILLLSRQRVRVIVVVTLGGLVVSGACIIGAPFFGFAACLAVAILAAFLTGAVPLVLDPELSSLKADGRLTQPELLRVPWMTVAMILACSFLAAVLYGVAEQLTWVYDWRPDGIVFIVSSAAVIGATLIIMTRSKAWYYVVWVPLFALFMLALLFSCMPTSYTIEAAIGFMLASVLCANFLPWLVFPSVFSSLKVPRAMLSGVVLVLANSSLATLVGDVIGAALPPNMQNLAGVSGLMAVLLAGLFAVSFVGYRNAFGAVGMWHSAEQNTPDDGSHSPESVDDARDPAKAMRERIGAFVEEYGLTPRESEVALYTVQGFSCAYIADKLVVSNSTVRFHQQNVYRKLEVHSRNELIELVVGENI